MIGFTNFLIMEINAETGKSLFNSTELFEHIGPGKEIEYSLRFKDKDLYCKKYQNCTAEELLYEDEKENYGEVSISFILSVLSCLITFFNGESFSSDSKRIKFLSPGRISLELRPIDAVTCLCKRKGSFDTLNFLFCYKATIFNIQTLLSIFSFIIFIFSLFLFIIWKNYFYPQTIFTSGYILLPPLLISIYSFLLGICCENCCCKNRTPNCKKCCVIIALIVTFIGFLGEIIGFPLIVGSMNGKIKYRIDCDNYNKYELIYENLYETICFEDSINKYLFVTMKGSSKDRVVLIFIIVLIEIILTFYLIVLMINYINRSIPEVGFKNRIYDAIMFFIDQTGEKINADDIKIESEIIKFTGNKGGKEVNYEKKVYKRIILSNQNQVPVSETNHINNINHIIYINN